MINVKNVEDRITELMNELKIFDKCSKEHVQDTPKRIAKMLIEEVFSSLYTDPPEITTFPNKNGNQIVTIKNIEVRSMCAHHWMPFYGFAHIAYKPNKKIAGLSKFARIVDYFSRKPQVQEELGREIILYLQEKLQPKAIGIYMSCIHLCMRHRGIESDNSITDTIYVLGDNEDDRKEIQNILLSIKTKDINI